ncbi:putative phostensin [Scophthalmus maximus]|uniref:Putative phostensin n=1 Tax=Scophthalmus maximus TaxID=52904 RepID=A0A2U9CZ36_SCOMX|nr:putative phostensin [Scophthalmus maximus]
MPAWKRGIIQRRKAKQDSVGDREKERDVCFLQVDFRPASDGLSDTDSSMTVNLCSEPSLSPDPGLWLDADPKPESQVSVETIVPLHENPFIRTQSAWRKGRDADVGSEPDSKEKEKLNPRGQDGEPGRGRHMELKRERFRDLSEGREKERSRDRSQGRERDNSRERWEKDKSQWKESAKDATREREFLKVRKDEEEKETDPPSGSVSPHVPCLRTIRADNIIIIEQDRKGSDDRKGIWREMERERPEEDHQVKRGMKMDLREILAGGGSVTEIRASEVLIIQPSANPEERNTGGKGREDGEMKCSLDMRRESRELRTDISWLREKEKERPWGQATVIKEGLKDSSDDNVFLERGGRVSQLLSKFGELPKPPSRSKSSDNFLRPGRRKYSDEDDQQSEERRADGRNMLLKGVPKRSFSFSDRVVCAKENGLGDESCYERKTRERTHSDKSVAPWLEVATAKIKMGCALLLDKDKSGKHRDGYGKTNEKGGPSQKRSDAETCVSIQHRSEVKIVEHIDKRAAEKLVDGNGDEGFTAVSVKNTEGISFARRIPIRQDGKTRAEREAKRSLERELSVEKDPEEGVQIEAQLGDKKGADFLRADGFESAIPLETMQNYVMAPSADAASPRLTAESHYRHESAFTECSSLLCTVTDKARDPHRGPEWSGAGPQGPYQAHSVLSQQTEDLLSKIEKIGDTTVYSSERGDRAYKDSPEPPKECKKEGQHYDVGSESLIHDATPRSPKRVAPPGPLEIQIPRTVFYVAEEVAERKKVVGQNNEERDWEGGQGVERRDSWRIGKPLSRIESLREKIRQKELERLRQRETRDGEGSEAAEVNETQTAGERYDERGSEIEPEWEAAAHMRKKVVEADTVQEDAAAQTSMAGFDVTQEVMKTYPQLPVSVPHSEADRGEEVTSGYATAAAEVISDRAQISDEEDDPLQHEEEQLRCDKGRRESREEEREVEEKALSEEEAEEYTSPLDPKQSLSPSPSHPNSLAAMSRIYNLESVRSRSGLCLRERTVDIPSVQLVKVKTHISNAQQGDSKALAGEDICAVQKIQRQIEQFQLKEQEALKSSTSPSTSLKDRETKRQQSPRGGSKHQVKDDFQTQEKDQSESNYKASPLRVCSPTSQLKQTITVNHSFLRTQSPDNSLRPSDCAPTRAPSPSSPSPTQSPSVSPSPSPSPTLFSIRSASGGKVKRGATITINPKRNAAGERGGGGGTGSTAGSTTSADSTPAKTTMQQAQVAPAAAEPMKKKYPTVEEIQVIGGYQNLEKSCLVKYRGTTKRVKVCFDEDQLEQPVPPLAHTLQGYLRALEPLLPADELSHTRRMVHEFGRPGGLGAQLQDGLERRARHSRNWISDWWVKWAYLESRQPLPVHSNPAISLPRRDYNDWRSQLVFASKLIAAVLDFRAKINAGQLPVEYMRGKPLCMDLYPLLFSSCRIPGPKHDHIAHHGRSRRFPAHITVVRNYQFFQLDVYNSDGSRLTESQIHSQLLRIRSQSWKTDKEPMGILTSEHRHTWGQAYNRLLRDKLNKESVRMIETGLFSLCLDSPVMRISDEKYASRKAAQILHGGGTFSNSGNRWFDKTLQFVVGEDGSWGLLYEQATAEGPPIATLLDHILQYCEKPDPKRAPLVPLSMPKKLYFHIDREIKRDIEHAKQNLDILINDLDVNVFNFKRFGKELPKEHGLSPNAFIQVALQLAYYRVHSEVCPACDIASQRMFRGGRTEYIRSPTNQTLKFILAFDDPTVSREVKLQLFREAVDAYTALTDLTLNGHGVDQHLLGLKLQAIEKGMTIPKIFMDTAYGLATHWKLRTGQVPANTDSVMCFGPLVPDGYAICYNPQADHVHFSITAFNCCEETHAETLAVTLKDTLCQLQELLQPTV